MRWTTPSMARRIRRRERYPASGESGAEGATLEQALHSGVGLLDLVIEAARGVALVEGVEVVVEHVGGGDVAGIAQQLGGDLGGTEMRGGGRLAQPVTRQPIRVERQHRQVFQVRALAEDPPRLTPGAVDQDEDGNEAILLGDDHGALVDHAMLVVRLVVGEDHERHVAPVRQQLEQPCLRRGAIPGEGLGLRQHVGDQAPGVGGLVVFVRVRQQPYPGVARRRHTVRAEAVEHRQAAPVAAFDETAPRLEFAARRGRVSASHVAPGVSIREFGLAQRPGFGRQFGIITHGSALSGLRKSGARAF